MSNNKFMDALDGRYGEEKSPVYLNDRDLAIFALVKELQTLNETLKELKEGVKGINLGLPID